MMSGLDKPFRAHHQNERIRPVWTTGSGDRVVFAGNVFVEDDELILKTLFIYNAGQEPKVKIGAGEVMRARKWFEDRARAEGFKLLTLSFKRISGADPDHDPLSPPEEITIDLATGRIVREQGFWSWVFSGFGWW